MDVEHLTEKIKSVVTQGVREGTRGIITILTSAVPESTKSDRIHNQEAFKQNLRTRYDCINISNPDVTKCMVLGVYLSTHLVAAAHLLSLKDRATVSLFGFSNIWDGRNGILVYKCIDDKYGSLELTFVPNFDTHSIQLRVLYDGVMDEELRPPIKRVTAGISGTGNVTYRDLHLKYLLLPSLVFPFRRLLVRHAKSAYDLLRENSKPHIVGNQTAPTDEEWEVMLEQCSSYSACGDCPYFQKTTPDTEADSDEAHS